MANRIETGLQITGLSGDTNALYVVGNSLVNGDVNITGNVNIIGTATTLNTETVQTKDNRILLNYSGTSLSAIGGGIEVLSAKTDGSNTSLTTDINSDWNMNVGLNITGRTSDNTAYALKVKNSANTDTLLVRNDGNVGIGVSNPTYKLHIDSGTNQFTGIYVQGTGANLYLDGTSGGSSVLFRTNGSPSFSIASQNTNTYFDMAGQTLFRDSIGEILGFFNPGTVSTTSVFKRPVQIITDGSGIGPSSTAFGIKSIDSSSSNFGLKVQNSGGTDNFVVRNDGIVGIGITNPTAKLHINNVTTDNTFFAEDDTNPDSTPFVIDNTGNVGIGSPTATYKLDVKGVIRAYGAGNVGSIISEDTQVGGASIVINPQLGLGEPSIGSVGNFPFIFTTNNNERVRITNTGNVGIGTLGGATARLQVKGDGTGTTNAFLVQNSSNTEILSVRNDGRIFLNTDCNVGIGNNTPFNAVLGVDALDSYTGASNTGANVAVGYEALKLNLDGGYNTAVGYQSLRNTTGNQNTAVNFSLWQNTTGIRNTAVGYNNLNNSITQNYNSAFGVENLLNLTSGTGNIALSPYRTMYSLVSGSDNVGVGNHIMTYITGGSSNTVVGNLSLSNTNLLSSNSNTVVGAYNFTTNPTGSSLTFENNTIIGRGINNWADSISNHVVIGDGSGNIRILSNNTGNVGIGTVSPTSKLDITGSTGYNQLRLRTSFTPSGSTDTSGNVGDIAWDDTYFYWKTSSQWLRVSGSTWP